MRNKKYHFYSAVASEAERFDYSYEAFVDAATKFNLKDPKVHNNWKPWGEILIPTLAESEGLLRMTETFGLTLEPMHHDTDDPNLQSYFIVGVPDHATAQRVIDGLQQSVAVEAAYVKPPDELP